MWLIYVSIPLCDMERMSLSDLVGVKAPRRYIPIIGDTYGLWTVIDDGIYSDRSIGRQTYWKVRCTCGSEVLRQAWYCLLYTSKLRTTSCRQLLRTSTFYRLGPVICL